jgi:hypothetical protein
LTPFVSELTRVNTGPALTKRLSRTKPRLLKMGVIGVLLAGIVALPADGQILTALKIMRNNQPPKTPGTSSKYQPETMRRP